MNEAIAVTAQQVFDEVATHLLQQDGPSRTENEGMCMYRGAHGRQCAVGILIPDASYSEELEGETIAEHRSGVCQALPEQYRPHVRLLRSLQIVHDYAPSETGLYREHIRSRLERTVEEYGLNAHVLRQ